MKQTPKKIIIGGVAALLVFGIVGAGVAFGIKAFSNSIDKLEDKWGSLINTDESDSSSDGSDSSQGGSGSTDDGGNVGENTKFTFANGDVRVGTLLGNGEDTAGKCLIAFYLTDLKPNTTYEVRWSLDSSIKDVPAYFLSKDFDGIVKPYIIVDSDLDPSIWNFWSSNDGTESNLLADNLEFTTNSNGTIMIILNYVYCETNEEAGTILDEYYKHVNYFEIEEVTE